MVYRYRCSECGFSTSWKNTPLEARDLGAVHCRDHHSTLYLGGHIEDDGSSERSFNRMLARVSTGMGTGGEKEIVMRWVKEMDEREP